MKYNLGLIKSAHIYLILLEYTSVLNCEENLRGRHVCPAGLVNTKFYALYRLVNNSGDCPRSLNPNTITHSSFFIFFPPFFSPLEG